MSWWPWVRRESKPRNTATRSISDPNLASWLGVDLAENHSGVTVNESSALGIPALYRAVALISGTIAQLPLRTLRTGPDGTTTPARSVFDAPGGQYGPTRYEWVETLLLHLLLHGNAYLVHRYNGAGGLDSLLLAHRSAVRHEQPPAGAEERPVGGQWFHVTWDDGTITRHDARTLTHIPAMTLDGLVGLSILDIARNSLGAAVAGDRAAARMFNKGALMGGIASLDEDSDPDELVDARREINRAASGWENAGGIAVVNRKVTLSPWTMKAVDAQFLQSRQFAVEDIARWTGVPPHLLMQTDKQTSWGTGVAEQNRGLGRFCLSPWTSRIEGRGSRLLSASRRLEFDFHLIERSAPEVEIGLIIDQINAGIIDADEGRAMLNYRPRTAPAAGPAGGDPGA